MTMQRGCRSWLHSATAGQILLSLLLLSGLTAPSLAASFPLQPATASSAFPLIRADNSGSKAISQTITKSPPILASGCATEIEALTAQLMLDLPSYSNRVIHRASKIGDPTPLYLIVAGQATVAPLSLDESSNSANSSRLPADPPQNPRSGDVSPEEIYQITFTTLERQYLQRRPRQSGAPQSPQSIEQQQKHGLILARNPTVDASPWRLISLRSQLTPYPAVGQVLDSPRNSRSGPIGQGIRIWLRDQQSQNTALACSQTGR